MKYSKFLYILIIAVVFTACKKDDEVPLTSLNVKNVEIVPSFTSADVRLNAGTNATMKDILLEYSTDSTFKEYREEKMTQTGKTGNQYQVTLSNLSDSTKYYIRCRATNKYSSLLANYLGNFTTLTISIPEIGSVLISEVEYSTATCKVDSMDDGGSPVTKRGICYSTNPDPTVSDNLIERGSGTKTFTCALADLKDSTTYYVRAYATNIKGTAYSEEQSFTTKKYKTPTITTNAASDISFTSATGGGEITADGGQAVTECGICYATSPEPTISDSKVTSDTRAGSFTCKLTGLTAGTKYYIRAYATNSIGIVYGNEITFTTMAYGTPVVTTTSASNITYTTATCGGNVTADGGQTVTARGVCYSTTSNPTISNSKVASGTGTWIFTCNLTGLTAGAKYYVRAYATNSKGTSYGDEIAFTTKAYSAPTVTTTAASNITQTTATCGGNVTADGGQTVTARGVCYSTTSNPTISNNKVTSGTGTGSFTCNLTGLTAGTKYYVRAYATNSKGTTYGTEKTFTTTAYSTPTVTTTAVSNITKTTATCGGNVTSDGGQTVTARGVCYSTISNPTISNSKVTSGSGTGSFACNLTGLTAGTKYYVRAYATNSKGTAYGSEVTFTTATATTPSVTTSSITNIANTSATCAGNVTSDGGTTVIERGVCYSTTSNPTISNSKVTSGTGTGSFTCNLLGLIAGTKYYVRAYATNSKGTTYGTEKTFTTTGTTSTITYTASAKLTETTATYSSGLHTNAFNVTISSHTFSNGTGTIIFNDVLTSIGYRAFYECSGLTSVTIPNSVTSIGIGAFGYCSDLTSVTIPSSVTSIGNHVFASCYRLTAINVASGNSYYSSSDGVLFNFNKTTIVAYPGGKSGSYSIPNSVTSIFGGAFNGCFRLTSIAIPNSVTSMGAEAFKGCSGLTSVTIGNSVTRIEINTFMDCTNLRSVTIGNGVTYIGISAFDDCSSLTSITCKATTPPTCGSNAFHNVTKSISVYVPSSSISKYKAADGWIEFTNFKSL